MEIILDFFAGELLFVVATLVLVAPFLLLWALVYLIRTLWSARPLLWLSGLLILCQTALCVITFAGFVPFPRLLWLEGAGLALSILALVAMMQAWRHPELAVAGKRLNVAAGLAAVWLLPPFAAVVMLLFGGV